MSTFTASVSKATLAEVVAIADALVEEVLLDCSADELSVRVMDAANVGMAHITVPASTFPSYETDGIQLGVVLSKLDDIIGMAATETPVEFDLNPETRKLDILAGNLQYTMGLIAPEMIATSDDRPSIPFDATIECPTAELRRAASAAQMVSDDLTFAVSDETFTISASGDTDDIDFESSDATLSAGTDGHIEDCSAVYSLDYLEAMLKAIEAETVRLSLASDMPCLIEFNLDAGAGTGCYLLAPRIGM